MKDIMRCLKRAIAREVYQELMRPTGFTTTSRHHQIPHRSRVDEL